MRRRSLDVQPSVAFSFVAFFITAMVMVFCLEFNDGGGSYEEKGRRGDIDIVWECAS